MPQVQTPGIGKRLQRLLGLEGSSPVPTVSPELVGTILTKDASRPEWNDPNEERIAGAFDDQTAGGAGVYSCVDLVNPADSGVIIVLEYATAWISATGWVQAKVITSPYALGLHAGGYYRDARIVGRSIGGTQLLASIVVPGNIVGRLYAIAGVDHGAYWNKPIVLGPDQAFRLACVTDNVHLYAEYQWREVLTSQTGV